MTSPLRKSRPTTPPSSNRPTGVNPPAACGLARAACALIALLPLAGADASATEWRPAGTAPTDANRSVLVRRDGVPRESDQNVAFDPFEEPLTDADAAMPTPEPAAEPAFDPFEENAAQVQEVAAPVTESRPAPDGRDESFSIEHAFGAPRVAIGPSIEEEFDNAQNAADEEMDRRDRGERDDARAPEQEAEEAFTTEDALDAPERDAEEFDPSDDWGAGDESDSSDLEEQFQQAPDGFDIRPLDPSGESAEDQAARRQAIEDQQIEAERIQNAETCEEFLAAVKADDIRTVSLSIRLDGRPGEDYPFDCGLGNELFQPRNWSQTTYLWKAAGLCHKPLYFEQVQMERYGHSWGPALDPLVAGAHFFGSVPLLPYKMGLMTPNECVYTLGYYRPGSCAPFMIEAVPFTWRAAAFEAGAWTGGAFAIP